MNILIAVGHFFRDQRGGASRIAWDCALWLHANGHDVVLLCEGDLGSHASEHFDGVRVLRYQQLSGRNPWRRHCRAAVALIQEQLGDWTPDLVWGHAPFQFLAACHVYPHARCNYVLHSPLPLEILQSCLEPDWRLRLKALAGKRIERKCLECAERVQVLSQFTQDCLQSLYPKIASKVVVTPGWADTDLFQPILNRAAAKRDLGWPTDAPVLFTARRLVPRMGIDRLIAALSGLKQKRANVHLYIAGDGEMRDTLEAQIKAMQLTESVRLMGGLEEDQLIKCMAACDAFVIPTIALECFGLIAVEAMSAGVPVLSTPIGALPEIIGRFEPRWFARDASPQALEVLIGSFVNRLLPTHERRALHHYVEQRYSHRNALPNFCNAATREPEAVSSELSA
jgi:glycosyltransferase involved in cell wall biosynthesis